MRKVLKNKSKNHSYLNSLPKIYMVGCWAKYGVWTLPFTGKYATDKNGISIPLVYDYDDHNGTCDNYYLRRIDQTTSGAIVMWTQNEKLAYKIAKLLNNKEETIKVEHINVPVVTLNASFTWPKDKQISEDRINEILARELSEEVIKYANIEWCDKIGTNIFDEQIVFKATVKVVGDRRDRYEAEKDYEYNAESCS